MSTTPHPEPGAPGAFLGTVPSAVPRVSPFCIYLLSKNIVKRARPMLDDEDVLDASNHCWCACTGQILGPDRFVAHPRDCRRGRVCFESPISDLT